MLFSAEDARADGNLTNGGPVVAVDKLNDKCLALVFKLWDASHQDVRYESVEESCGSLELQSGGLQFTCVVFSDDSRARDCKLLLSRNDWIVMN